MRVPKLLAKGERLTEQQFTAAMVLNVKETVPNKKPHSIMQPTS